MPNSRCRGFCCCLWSDAELKYMTVLAAPSDVSSRWSGRLAGRSAGRPVGRSAGRSVVVLSNPEQVSRDCRPSGEWRQAGAQPSSEVPGEKKLHCARFPVTTELVATLTAAAAAVAEHKMTMTTMKKRTPLRSTVFAIFVRYLPLKTLSRFQSSSRQVAIEDTISCSCCKQLYSRQNKNMVRGRFSGWCQGCRQSTTHSDKRPHRPIAISWDDMHVGMYVVQRRSSCQRGERGRGEGGTGLVVRNDTLRALSAQQNSRALRVRNQESRCHAYRSGKW